MNERFFSLPEKKQQSIINAGYRVFAHNTYKNSPVSEPDLEEVFMHYYEKEGERA